MRLVVLSLLAVVVGLALGFTVSPAFFLLTVAGAVGTATGLTLALFRAMRPALHPPTKARTGYHWTTFFIRKLGDPPAAPPKPQTTASHEPNVSPTTTPTDPAAKDRPS